MVYTRASAPTYLFEFLAHYFACTYYCTCTSLYSGLYFRLSFSQMNFFFWALTLFNFQGSSSARSLSELVYYTSLSSVCQHFFSTFFSFFRAALLFASSAVQRMLYYHLFPRLSTTFFPFFCLSLSFFRFVQSLPPFLSAPLVILPVIIILIPNCSAESFFRWAEAA